ncbi:oxysterol-binding protein-related protein 2 [Equus quagga]|uniref:oxysterol-binding protein-related protein 2 n=1 Tax=Equus quagga TaxID=89248 RepID=UPI001EE27F6F|nr:oxysterol-binding protein-related protein 2 [Equus quagga]
MNGEEEFFDAVTGFDSDNSSGEFSEANQRVTGVIHVDTSKSNGIGKVGERPPQENGLQKHRTSLPAPMFTRSDFSVWSILKKCIGLELSKITMPIAFNEPLSFLQRITEYMEHVYLIHKASRQPQPLDRMQSVAAFAVSAVASQWERTGKPFNPLLGETYELIREDLGFRFISEQVSHHPPISAFYSEGLSQDFLFHGSIYPKLKFWGKSVEAEPRGTITLELLKHDEAYTWTNPTCCVHNVIIGKLWIEQYGTVEILNHRTGDKCVLHFRPCGLFGKELHKVEGHIQDRSKKKLFMIYGKWTECLWGIDPVAYESFKKQERRGDHLRKGRPMDNSSEKADGDVVDAVPEVQETVQVIPGSKLLWRVNTRPPNSAQTWRARRRSGWRRSREQCDCPGPQRRRGSGHSGGFTRAVTPTRGPPTGYTQGATLSGTSQAAQISTEGPVWPQDLETERLDAIKWLLGASVLAETSFSKDPVHGDGTIPGRGLSSN